MASFHVFLTVPPLPVNGCNLYIIIHYGMLQRDQGIRLALRGGTPEPESSKALDTYAYSKNHTNSTYVCPRMC